MFQNIVDSSTPFWGLRSLSFVSFVTLARIDVAVAEDFTAYGDDVRCEAADAVGYSSFAVFADKPGWSILRREFYLLIS